MISELLIESLKQSIGLTISIYTEKNFYHEGVLLDIDNTFIKLKDRKKGIILLRLQELKEVFLK